MKRILTTLLNSAQVKTPREAENHSDKFLYVLASLSFIMLILLWKLAFHKSSESWTSNLWDVWRSKIKMFCFNCIIDSFVSSYKLHYTHVSQLCAHKVMGHESQLSEVIAISKWQFVYVCMPFQRWPAIFVLPKVLRVLSLFPHPYKSLKWLHSDCRGSRTLIWILQYIFSLYIFIEI